MARKEYLLKDSMGGEATYYAWNSARKAISKRLETLMDERPEIGEWFVERSSACEKGKIFPNKFQHDYGVMVWASENGTEVTFTLERIK